MSLKINELKGIWNVLIILCTSYLAIFIPLHLLFDFSIGLFGFLDNIITFIFLFDVWVRFKEYHKIQNAHSFEGGKRRFDYNLFLLLTDIIAAIPFGLFLPISLFGLIRLIKLIRVFNLFYAYRQKQISSTGILSFLIYLFWIFHIIHWLACGWILFKGCDYDIDFASNYVNALYWTVTTLTTVGYGDILPVSNPQKIYSMFVQILGFGVFGFLIGTIASLLMKKDPAKSRYYENIENLASLIHYRRIPANLQSRIVDFYTFMWKKRLGYDETTFLKSLPESLRTEVALYLKKEVIEKITLFQNSSSEFKREIALLLRPIFLTPGDYIFKTGDHGEEMYFVVNGSLNTLTQAEDRILITLKSGDYFGEIALFKNKTRTATLRAISYCDLYVLDQKAFNKVLSKYPDIGEKIKKQVEIRESRYLV